MATILLGAAGAAVGSGIGGSLLGATAGAWGRAIGASVGGLIDQGLFGPGDTVVERGKIDSFRLQNAVEGAPIGRSYGRTRLAGHVIWASPFYETVSSSSSGGGKFNSQPTVTTETFTYSISLAIALCEGEIVKIGRVWVDGEEVNRSELPMTIYTGSADQTPDSVIASHLGASNTPAFRNTAYVVFDNLQLAPYGNRVPQFNFEVFRRAQPKNLDQKPVNDLIRGVALMPGSGEYVLATTPVNYSGDYGFNQSANVHTDRGATDIVHALDDLEVDLPNSDSVLLVTSWFGSDLRCSDCVLEPKVEQSEIDGAEMPWSVSGVSRGNAKVVSLEGERPVFGGTPCDASVIEAISDMNSRGKAVVFYPFIMMDIQAGNGLPDPWGWGEEQSVIPWRGRITGSLAPSQSGTSDKTALARAEVDAFFGIVSVSDFEIVGDTVQYSGPPEWSYRRFILHYAYLCAAAGGVAAFCIGSEMRGLTQMRDQNNAFPTVEHLVSLASDVRQVLGANTKIGYAADWSEYFGYQPTDGSGDLFFHLDPLWAHADIDFIGVDNYMPLSDWRDTEDHLDADWGAVYELDYLKSNIEGGEGFDWYYATAHDRDIQNRTPITDGAYGEPWVYRYKDMRSWWGNQHFNRIGGVREASATNWLPKSKPFWFTEFGFPAVDKGTNQPNVFIDPKSSESAAPYFSNLEHDPEIQASGLRALMEYWGDTDTNPKSDVYDGCMIDISRAHVWAWDARPWPDFPYRETVWSDAANYELGHWVSGRMGGDQLSHIVAEICEASGVVDIDVSSLNAIVDGYWVKGGTTGREALEILMSAYGVVCSEVEGVLVFKQLNSDVVGDVAIDGLVFDQETDEVISRSRNSAIASVERVSLGFWNADVDYQFSQLEARTVDAKMPTVMRTEFPLVLRKSFASGLVDRMLSDYVFSKETVTFSLPMSEVSFAVGDVVTIPDLSRDARYRISGIEEQGYRRVEARRVRVNDYALSSVRNETSVLPEFVVSNPVHAQFLDLPLLKTEDRAVGPYVAATATPWPGGVAVYQSAAEGDYALDMVTYQKSIFGETLEELPSAFPHRWAEQSILVKVTGGVLESVSQRQVFAGQNRMAIRENPESEWEIVQYQYAVLEGEDTYRLSRFLRGQLGTDVFIPSVYGSGVEVVFLKDGMQQLSAQAADFGEITSVRYGPSGLSLSDDSYLDVDVELKGVGLRPYGVVHPKAIVGENGDIVLSWIRRTRAVGEYWAAQEVPLAESVERYAVSVSGQGPVVRSFETTKTDLTYSQADRLADGINGVIAFSILQVSEIYGPGPATRITINV